MALTVTTQPTAEPVSVDEAKQHLNLLNNDHDTYIASLIKTARRKCESYTRQACMPTTFEEVFFCWPKYYFELSRSPLVSVDVVSYIDSAGASQTLAATEYTYDAKSRPGRFIRGHEKTLPTLRVTGVASPVAVEYQAGHATADLCPEEIKHAIKLLVGQWFQVRESAAQVNFRETPHAVDDLLSSAMHGEYP